MSRHSMATDTDMTRRAVRARLLRVCVSQTRSRPERAKTDRTQPHTTRKGNKSRDIATNARLPAIPHRTRQVCIQRSRVEEWNGKAQNPIAAAVSETIASLCPGLKPVSLCSDHHANVLLLRIHRPHDAPPHRHLPLAIETARTRTLRLLCHRRCVRITLKLKSPGVSHARARGKLRTNLPEKVHVGNWGLLQDQNLKDKIARGEPLQRSTRWSLTCRDIAKVSTNLQRLRGAILSP